MVVAAKRSSRVRAHFHAKKGMWVEKTKRRSSGGTAETLVESIGEGGR